MTTDLHRRVLGDDWPGAWDAVSWERPEDWRDVVDQLVWDVAVAAAGWVWLEAAHDQPSEQDHIRHVLWELTEVFQADLPWFLGVGPTTPRGRDQPQLPMIDFDADPLERLSERPADVSWQGHFAVKAQERVTTALKRAGLDEDDQTALRLAGNLGSQLALQVEWLLRDQEPTLLPFIEELLALHLDDAALGAALHVVVDEGELPIGLCLVSHDGRPRATLAVRGDAASTLHDLVTSLVV